MAYKKAELEAQALDAIKKHRLVFIQDLIPFLPCAASTFYDKELEKSEAIKEALEYNKISLKVNLRKRWYESEVPVLQLALYKLIGTDDETERLNGSKQKLEHSGANGGPIQSEVRVILPYDDTESSSD